MILYTVEPFGPRRPPVLFNEVVRMSIRPSISTTRTNEARVAFAVQCIALVSRRAFDWPAYGEGISLLACEVRTLQDLCGSPRGWFRPILRFIHEGKQTCGPADTEGDVLVIDTLTDEVAEWGKKHEVEAILPLEMLPSGEWLRSVADSVMLRCRQVLGPVGGAP